MGKTTVASKFKNSLIFAFEIGYNALPGVYAQPIDSWEFFIRVLQELKQEEQKEKFNTIIIDTVDLAYEACEQYVCRINGVSKIKDIPYGAGFAEAGQEFDRRLREITNLGYGLVLISHAKDKTFTDSEGNEFNKIVPTLSDRGKIICSRLSDIYIYVRSIQDEEGKSSVYAFLRGTPRFEAGSRFKYMVDHIQLSYDNLTQAIADAIDKEAKENNYSLVQDNKEEIEINTVDNSTETYSQLIENINNIIADLMKEPKNGIKIQSIISNYLGNNRKLADSTPNDNQSLSYIEADLQDLM